MAHGFVAFRWIPHFLCLVVIILTAALLTSCAGPRHYSGYKHRPYTVRGVRYEPLAPREALRFIETGIASHYKEGGWFFAGKTALGERYRGAAMEGAHKTLPIPCVIEVVNLKNRRRIVVRINDRGPFIAGRVIDLTPAAAKKLGFYKQGLAPVRIRVLSVGDGKYRIR
jgi:rare lipoprotein A